MLYCSALTLGDFSVFLAFFIFVNNSPTLLANRVFFALSIFNVFASIFISFSMELSCWTSFKFSSCTRTNSEALASDSSSDMKCR